MSSYSDAQQIVVEVEGGEGPAGKSALQAAKDAGLISQDATEAQFIAYLGGGYAANPGPIDSAAMPYVNPRAPALAQTRFAQDRMGDTVSVLDFIPTSMQDAIRTDPNNTNELSTYFRRATIAANRGIEAGQGPGGTVYIPNGYYTLSGLGIRDTVMKGESREGVRLIARAPGDANLFMLDAMVDRDAAGNVNTLGRGWAEDLTIDAGTSGRSGLRTYGGGVNPRSLNIQNAAIGVSAGLPIWSVFQMIHAKNCGVGFKTFHAATGDIGTSATFMGCWADTCTQHGFHITQLAYSSFINCVGQDCGGRNFYVEGDANGVPAVYSLAFLNCASEGNGQPFYMRKVRDLLMDSPRLIAPGAVVDQDIITLDDAQGKIDTYSIVASLAQGRYHVKLVNPTFAPGGVLLSNPNDVTYNPEMKGYFQSIGGTFGGKSLPALIPGFEFNDVQAANRISAFLANIDGYMGLTFQDASGEELMRLRRGGTPIFRTNGGIIEPATNLKPGDVSFYVDTNAQKLRFVVKDGSGNMRTFSFTPDA